MGSGERFEKALEHIREKSVRAHEKHSRGEDAKAEIDAIKAKKAELETIDSELKTDFAATEKKLKDAKLPKEILDRHKKFVKHYEDNFKELKTNLDDVDKAKTGSARAAKMQKVREHLEKVKAPKRHKPLDPNNLPHRMVKAKKEKAPRLKKEEFEKDFGPQKKRKKIHDAGYRMPGGNLASWIRNHASAPNPILVAANGSLAGLLSSSPEFKIQSMPFSVNSVTSVANDVVPQFMVAQAIVTPPSADDLSETPEVQFTPEIRALAAQLDHNPVKIYNWVRNNIIYQPYYGTFKGAAQTLVEGAGNDFDQASLLIALLRVSNIAAKYSYGTVDISIDKVMNWVGGMTDPKIAGTILSTQGIPAKLMRSGADYKSVQMEHVWVEAWIDYIPSRGAVHKQGDTWIPLDASFKQYTYKQGMDMYGLMNFNAEEFLMSYVTDTRDITAYQDYSMRMINYLDANYPNASVEDVLGASEIRLTKNIVTQELPYLLGTLPYKVIVKAAQFSEAPAAKDYTITIQIEGDPLEMTGGLNYANGLNYLSDKRITVSYDPATSADQALLANAGGNIYAVPPYAMQVKPVLRINGTVVATGDPIGLGQDQNIAINFAGPDGDTDRIDNVITAGNYSAIILQSQDTPVSAPSRNMAKLIEYSEKTDLPIVTLDDLLGQLLYSIGTAYFHHLSYENEIISKTLQVIYMRQPSEAMVTHGVKVNNLFGMPLSVNEGGINLDVDRNVNAVYSPTQNKEREKAFMFLSGLTSSVWESRVLETFFNVPTVSAVRLLKLASEHKVPLYTITNANVNVIMPLLQVAGDVKVCLANAVNAGNTVIIPKTDLTLEQWSGVGYIIINSTTGAGSYMISGGLAGSDTAKILTNPPTFMKKSSYQYFVKKSLFKSLIVGNAKAYLYTDYVYGGKDPDSGFDCSGFTKYIVKLAGYDIPDGAANQYNYFQSNNMLFDKPEPADLFFYRNSKGKINHVGFIEGVTEDGSGNPLTVYIIDSIETDEHNYVTMFVDQRSLSVTNSYWKSHIAGFGRIME